MEEHEMGSRIIDAIADGGLVNVEAAVGMPSGTVPALTNAEGVMPVVLRNPEAVFLWAANAEEQLGALVMELTEYTEPERETEYAPRGVPFRQLRLISLLFFAAGLLLGAMSCLILS